MTQLESETAYLDAHVVAYPVEYIAGIDLYNAGEFTRRTTRGKNVGWVKLDQARNCFFRL